MEKQPICPIMALCPGGGYGPALCIQARCAMWCGDACAVVHIARAVEAMMKKSAALGATNTQDGQVEQNEKPVSAFHDT